MHLIRMVVVVVTAVVFACSRLQMSQCARNSLFPPTTLRLSSVIARQDQNKNQNIAPAK